MEIVPNDSTTFRYSIDAMRDFLPQAQIRISEDGVSISGMDASHVGFVDYFLSKQDCTTLKVPSPTVLGVNLSVLSRTLSAVSSGEKVTLTTKNDSLIVSYTNEKANKKAIYTIGTLDITEETMSIPKFAYAASVELKTTDIVTVIKEVAHFGDEMKLRLDEDGFHISASGEGGAVLQTLENTDDREMTLEEDSVEATFATKYVSSIMKSGQPLSSTTKLEFDGSQPLRTSFHFGEASYFVAYLAPKLTDS